MPKLIYDATCPICQEHHEIVECRHEDHEVSWAKCPVSGAEFKVAGLFSSDK